MTGNCGSCKWWRRLPGGEGYCKLTTTARETGEPRHPSLARAYAWDGEGPFVPKGGYLLTEPSFGCVQWAAKDDEC